MNRYQIRFARSLDEDATPAGVKLPNIAANIRPALVAQLARELAAFSTHGAGKPRSAIPAISLRWHRWAGNRDTYGILGECVSPLSLSRLRSALQGLYDRGMAGEFVIVPV